METTDQEKLKLGLESIKSFVEQFPNDFNTKIVMEVLWNELLLYNSEKKNESIPIPSQKK
jgi:hypothetical protein